MSSTNEVAASPDQGQRTPVHGFALVAAGIALILWAVFTTFMIVKANTSNEVQWARLAYLFASVEAIAFGAAGALWGTTINRERAVQAEHRAAANERDASNGRAMASSQIAEAGEIVDQTDDSALQRMGGGPDPAAAAVLQRHANQARMLFPDL
jgi:Na+/melibiose symporter-like transporter